MKILLTSTLIILLLITANGQTNLTKNEILLLWASSNNKADTIKDIRNITITFDPTANKRIISLIDSLNNHGIDSVIIYTIAYPGYISTDPCIEYSYPVYSYLLWKSKKEIDIKTIKGKCETNITKIDSSNIFDYYRKNEESIVKEIVMPVILSAQRLGVDKTSYSMSSIDHEPNYSLYFVYGKKFKAVNFTQDGIENEKSLFHEYNQNLKTIHLWNLIKNEIAGVRD